LTMRKGDLVRISGRDDPYDFAIIIEIIDVGPDGPSMDSYATAIVDGKAIFVCLYQCEVIGERSED